MSVIELGKRGLREAGTLGAAMDTILIEPRTYEDGPLLCKPGVTYRSADPTGNQRWRVEGCDGVLAAAHADVRDVVFDGHGQADIGVASGDPTRPGESPACRAFRLDAYEIRGYGRAAIIQAHGQWPYWLARKNWRGTGDDWWILTNGLHIANGTAEGVNGDSDTVIYGSDLHAHNVTWLETGPDHAVYAKGRGLRLDRYCRFIRCDRALSIRCGNVIIRAGFYGCSDAISYIANDVTHLGGTIQIGPGVELSGCGGEYLIYLDASVVEGTQLVPDLDFALDGITIRGGGAAIDFRDLTTKARRPVTLRAVDQDGADLIRPGFDPSLVTLYP